MRLMIRGILWFGLYLFLVLLPLATAALTGADTVTPPSSFLAAVGVGLGFVGLSLMALEFALISRIKPAAEAFGEDSLQLFHNLMGMVALGLLLVHPILLIVSGYRANCWLNPLADCANASTRGASLALYALLILVGTSVFRKRLGIRYEGWQVMHGLLALFILYAALVHITIIGRYTRTPAMEIVWWIYVILVTGLILWYKILKPILNWNQKWEVVENRAERGGAHTLVLKPKDHDGFSFLPGQFSWLKIGRTPFGTGQHPISMSSPADVPPGGTVTFTIKNLGDWSGSQVPAMKPGDTLWVDGPHGVFSSDTHQGMGYVLIGGGVGITPLYAMCQTMAERGDVRPVYLFYGSQDWESVTFREQLAELEGRMNLRVIHVLSDPEEGWQGETGFINVEVLQRHLPDQYRRFMFLICGPPPLMDAMEKALPELGIARDQVQTERFEMV